MRVKFVLESDDIALPVSYGRLARAAFYSVLGDFGADLHEGRRLPGEEAGRAYRMFTFSRIFFDSDYTVRDGTLFYPGGEASLFFSAVDAELIARLAEALFPPSRIRLGPAIFTVAEVSAIARPDFPDHQPVLFRTLSSITSRTTLYTSDGRKKSYFYDPQEKEWEEQILANLARKARKLGIAGDPDRDLADSYVRPIRTRLHRVRGDDGERIDAHGGLFEARLPRAYLELAYDAGMGERNSGGFGMIEIMEERPRRGGGQRTRPGERRN